jgi:hypothetical protein
MCASGDEPKPMEAIHTVIRSYVDLIVRGSCRLIHNAQRIVAAFFELNCEGFNY